MIDTELLALLACPVHHCDVTPADPELVQQLNARIDAGQLRNRGGKTIRRRIDGALVCSEGSCVFPVEHDIPSMMAEECLLLHEAPTG